MKQLLLTIPALLFSITAAAASAPPPEQITRAAYENWLRSIDSAVSPFADSMFEWYDEQLRDPIPSGVNRDPDKIFVTVARPLREAIEMEESGEVETGTTIGFEAYAIIDAPVETALEAKLFGWGKPVGKREGHTYPFDTVFSERHDILREKWGAGNYLCSTEQTKGGFVKDLRDNYTLLVRGNATDGYMVLAGFFGENGKTPTTTHISIVMLRPLPNGKTELRQNVRQNGQSYKIFGLDHGRRKYGFNAERVHQGEKEFIATILELKRTGKIRENKPKRD